MHFYFNSSDPNNQINGYFGKGFTQISHTNTFQEKMP